LTLLLLAGCIVGDELTTLTVHPDGSAELVILRSNLHSTEKGEKADKEITEYRSRFDTLTDGEFARIQGAGGSIEATTWFRRQAPLSNVVHARFPNAAALEKYWTIRSDDGGSLVTSEFHADGIHRRLTFQVTVPHDETTSPPAAMVDARQFQQSQANGISVNRFAVANGAITGARGFTVADDKQSAVLNSTEIAAVIRDGRGTADLYLAWDVTQ
jgi:hypothetical protein